MFGPLFHKTALSRFSSTLAMLLSAGVPILQAFDIVTDTVNNKVVAGAVTDVQSSVREGESIAKPLAKHAVFPPMVVQMIAVGEETGQVDTMLEKVAQFYDQEVEASVDALTSLIEPLLIAVIGACVGGAVIALYMPMFNIIIRDQVVRTRSRSRCGQPASYPFAGRSARWTRTSVRPATSGRRGGDRKREGTRTDGVRTSQGKELTAHAQALDEARR